MENCRLKTYKKKTPPGCAYYSEIVYLLPSALVAVSTNGVYNNRRGKQLDDTPKVNCELLDIFLANLPLNFPSVQPIPLVV